MHSILEKPPFILFYERSFFMFKKIISIVLLTVILSLSAGAEEIDITAKSAILVDASSGEVLYEKNPDEKMPPASITKIMTMLLTMEEIDKGRISVDDVVTVSKDAAIKTGSHVFLAENEQITVNDLLKAVAVASANDGAIALAEYVSGTKESFVEKMNLKAKELGMNNTNFVNVNGLDVENHYSTARDISIMTRELMKHPKIFEYTTIWMDTLRNGTFDLANTNKLIKFYEGATGMKTGSTSKAGYCISATAQRNGMNLIAVVMNSEGTKKRFNDASKLLNYGFNSFSSLKLNSKDETVKYANVEKGEKQTVPLIAKDDLFVTVKSDCKDKIQKTENIPDVVTSPIKKGEKIGEISYKLDGKLLKSVDIVANEDIPKISFKFIFMDVLDGFLGINSNNPQ